MIAVIHERTQFVAVVLACDRENRQRDFLELLTHGQHRVVVSVSRRVLEYALEIEGRISDAILLKPGRLDDEEYAVMQQHPVIGDSICRELRLLHDVSPIVRHHHERADGTGYPDKLAGDQIPLLAQIVSIVDVFDALTTDRPYRKALPTATAYRMMRDDARGGWCREDLVAAFIDLHRARELERDGVAV